MILYPDGCYRFEVKLTKQLVSSSWIMFPKTPMDPDDDLMTVPKQPKLTIELVTSLMILYPKRIRFRNMSPNRRGKRIQSSLVSSEFDTFGD